ncbi:MAG: prephenate dehydratase [Planctomycetes bacterium]|nr:prephenate dehydratase [Planctomycetota bacterium]
MSLEELRSRIDVYDREIVRLLNERARIAQQIGQLKNQRNSHIFDPNREREIYTRLLKENPGPLSTQCLLAVYREIMSGSFELERSLRVSFLGPEASFSHLAARRKFGSCVEFLAETDIPSVFLAVVKGRADYGVVPVQNSLEGGVNDALDTFLEVEVSICSELLVPITQCLLAKCPREQVRRVYSKPQALAQCRRWLRENLPQAECVDEASTASAARRAAQETGAAAVASEIAAEVYQLQILERAIEDGPRNVTRFIVLGNQTTVPTGHDKTSLLFRARNEPGALCKLLLPLKERNLNITWLDYRPSRELGWEYVFFLDIQGHKDDPNVHEALDDLRTIASYLRVLGSFPVAVSV